MAERFPEITAAAKPAGMSYGGDRLPALRKHPACDLEPVAGHIFCRSHMQAAAEDAVAFSFAEIGGCGKVRDGDLFGKMFVHIDHHRLYLVLRAADGGGRLLKYRRDEL